MRPDNHAEYKQWSGDTCIVIWEPEKVGMEFVAQTAKPLTLRVEDVHTARAELDSKAVTFFGDTLTTSRRTGRDRCDEGSTLRRLAERAARCPYGRI